MEIAKVPTRCMGAPILRTHYIAATITTLAIGTLTLLVTAVCAFKSSIYSMRALQFLGGAGTYLLVVSSLLFTNCLIEARRPLQDQVVLTAGGTPLPPSSCWHKLLSPRVK